MMAGCNERSCFGNQERKITESNEEDLKKRDEKGHLRSDTKKFGARGKGKKENFIGKKEREKEPSSKVPVKARPKEKKRF